MEGERLVGHEPVDPEGGAAVDEEGAGDEQRASQDTALGRRLWGGVELLAAGDDDERDEQREHGTDREPAQRVQRRETGEQDGRELPGPAFPAREASRHYDECEPDRGDQRSRHRVRAGGGERVDEALAVLGQDPVEHAQEADDGNAERDQRRRRSASGLLREPRQRAREPGERGRHVDRADPRGGVERLVRGNLADDQDRHSGREVAPEPDSEREHERARRALEAHEPGEKTEEQPCRGPDGDEEQQRDAGVLRELVERERVPDGRPRQGDVGPDQVEPARCRHDDREPRQRGDSDRGVTERSSHARGGTPRR